MHTLDCRIRLTFIRRTQPGSDRPVVNILPPITQPASAITSVRIAPGADLPTEQQWSIITDGLQRGITVALSCVDLDHALDVVRAVAIETGRVTDPELLRAGAAA
jgi:hypothetical protein